MPRPKRPRSRRRHIDQRQRPPTLPPKTCGRSAQPINRRIGRSSGSAPSMQSLARVLLRWQVSPARRPSLPMRSEPHGELTRPPTDRRRQPRRRLRDRSSTDTRLPGSRAATARWSATAGRRPATSSDRRQQAGHRVSRGLRKSGIVVWPSCRIASRRRSRRPPNELGTDRRRLQGIKIRPRAATLVLYVRVMLVFATRDGRLHSGGKAAAARLRFRLARPPSVSSRLAVRAHNDGGYWILTSSIQPLEEKWKSAGGGRG